jgi:uncharacterized protein (TIGR02145 family)
MKDYDKVLCPDGWRMPTKQDFEDLADFLGTGSSNIAKWTGQGANEWGGEFNGYVSSSGYLLSQGEQGYYRSITKYDGETYNELHGEYHLVFWTSGVVYAPSEAPRKDDGMTIRCVKDVK